MCVCRQDVVYHPVPRMKMYSTKPSQGELVYR